MEEIYFFGARKGDISDLVSLFKLSLRGHSALHVPLVSTILLPLLALDLLLSVMTDPVEAIHALFADKFFSGHFAIGVEDAS